VTAEVIISVQDTRGALSQPDTVFVPVGLSGGVKWHWQSPAEEGFFNTSPLCVYDGEDECISAGCYWEESFYSLTARKGKTKRRAQPMRSPYVFTGQPAFCAVTQHYIVGSEEGELYALGLDLETVWRWPNAPTESLEPMVLFGAPAIRDNRLYVLRDDDSLYYFTDSIDHGVRVATFAADAGIVDAPVIDVQGDIYFGTESGYLYKVGPELDTVLWRTRLIANGEIRSPIIGGDGTIFCSSALSRIYAIDPATGTLLWTAATEGLPLKLAAGRAAVFAGTDFGTVYSINPATGSVNWRRAFGLGLGFRTAPIVAANGCVYLQDDNDVLYCLSQPDGVLIWACDCNYYLPGGKPSRSKKTGFPHYDPDPTITSTGDVIVPGQSAVFCVVGYPEGPLDPLAPWPKWQHDLYNTGYVGVGR
jgi:outer membrane protein assembly factor BamB